MMVALRRSWHVTITAAVPRPATDASPTELVAVSRLRVVRSGTLW